MSEVKVINAASDKHHDQIKRLGDFLGLRSVSYTDHGNRESYVLERQNGDTLEIRACGNKHDGGFLAVTGTDGS